MCIMQNYFGISSNHDLPHHDLLEPSSNTAALAHLFAHGVGQQVEHRQAARLEQPRHALALPAGPLAHHLPGQLLQLGRTPPAVRAAQLVIYRDYKCCYIRSNYILYFIYRSIALHRFFKLFWKKTDRKTTIFSWKTPKNDRLNKYFRLKRIAAAQE
jgi:hypothetical protein